MAALPDSGPCTRENVEIRKEFRTLALAERKAYIAAILCPQSLPSIFNQTEYVGAKSRYDDFVAIHIELALVIHFTVRFLKNSSNHANLGPHGGGHFTIAGDPGSDFKVFPGDPVFWLHHGQIDRVYWIWQNVNADQTAYRQSNIPNLTQTLMDTPPSPMGTLDDELDLGPLNPPLKIRDSLSTITGAPFCYIYL